MRYKKHSYNGLYHFIQLFVVSNGVDTKYFANSDRDMDDLFNVGVGCENLCRLKGSQCLSCAGCMPYVGIAVSKCSLPDKGFHRIYKMKRLSSLLMSVTVVSLGICIRTSFGTSKRRNFLVLPAHPVLRYGLRSATSVPRTYRVRLHQSHPPLWDRPSQNHLPLF